MDEKVQLAMKKLKKYSQEHILNGFENLDEIKQKQLLDQIERIDFDLISNLYDKTKQSVNNIESDIKPIEYLDKSKYMDEYKHYQLAGENAIRHRKLAVVTMAGGQGTRLGHNGPKGTFDIGLDSHKSLFELLSDSIKTEGRKYDVVVPWFIMTSRENNKETVDFFEKHRFFGFEKDKNIFFFKQGELPMVDTEGKILIGEDGLIKEAADGHGGIYEALVRTGMTKKMRDLGVEWIFIGGVDNCLAKMVDPLLVGIAINKHVTAAGKSVVKANPKEKVGVFCKKNGKPSVVEYTEISPEMSEAVGEDGQLVYGESHILCNLFNIDAVERMGSKQLPYHVAFKKATYIDKDGNKVVPDGPNAYKFEAFLFDAFGDLDDMAILRVKREEEFAPVKNATGTDSPETARELYMNLNKKLRGEDDELFR